LGTGDVVLVVLMLAGQINSSTTLDLFLPTSGDRPFYTGPWWSDATARAGYAMTSTTTLNGMFDIFALFRYVPNLSYQTGFF